MPLKRALAGVVILTGAACLQTGSPTYGKIDTTPPSILSIDPDVPLDGGGSAQVAASGTIKVTFSDQMDPTSLRPGIAIRDGTTGQELAYEIQADTLPVTDYDADTAGNPDPYTVILRSGQGTFAQGIYSLTFRTLLLDQHGNPLAAEQSGVFFVK